MNLQPLDCTTVSPVIALDIFFPEVVLGPNDWIRTDIFRDDYGSERRLEKVGIKSQVLEDAGAKVHEGVPECRRPLRPRLGLEVSFSGSLFRFRDLSNSTSTIGIHLWVKIG